MTRGRTVAPLLAALALAASASGVALALERPAARKPLVGVLTPAASQWKEAAFRARLAELGHVPGTNLELDVRSGDGRLDRMPALARALVARRPDVIVGLNTPGTRAALEATRTIPVVMAMVGDPIGLGFVKSLARPEGNVTGVSNMVGILAAKRLQLLREALPNATRIGLLYHPDEPIVIPQVRDLDALGAKHGLQYRMLAVRNAADTARAFEEAATWGAHAVLRLAGQAVTTARPAAEQALLRRIPVMQHSPRHLERGGLMSYYVDEDTAFRRVADYVDRILRGARPGELPVEQPSRFELVVSLRTAKALGITIPQNLLLRADRVIE